jgi:hypothetical protein
MTSAALVAALVLACSPVVAAERPSAMKLFPEETLLFVRAANAYEFGQRIRDSSTGRMLADPQLKPFVDEVYGEAGKLYADRVQEILGITFEDLQKLPHGEVAFGIVARADETPAFLLLVDEGDEPSVADRLVERGLEFAEENGADISTDDISGVEVIVIRDADDESKMFGVFERDNTIVVATDPNVLRGVLHHWDGGENGAGANEETSADHRENEGGEDEAAIDDEEPEDADVPAEESEDEEKQFVPGRTLAENVRFTTILQQCRRPQDPPPHLIFFAEPIEIVRNFGRGQGGVDFAMGLLPSLGLDGFHGLGAAFTAATDQYDDLSHFHVLLQNPRSGVLQLPAFEQGETAPQPFVPLATETYMTWHWNMRVAYDRIVALVDQYRYEGSVDKMVEERLSEPLGIDVQKDVIDNLAGRYTWIIGYEQPATIRGQQHVLAIELKDEAAAQKTLENVMSKFEGVFEKRRFGNVEYHAILPEGLKEAEEEDRPMEPCVAIMDGYLFVGTSCQLLERAIQARDGTIERLVDSNDYARVTEVIGRETAGLTPVLFTLSRYEESVKQWYSLLTSERIRELIDENKEDNPVLASLAKLLDENKLPPFEVLAPYLPPGGAILYDTDSGFHGIGFTLRNEQP